MRRRGCHRLALVCPLLPRPSRLRRRETSVGHGDPDPERVSYNSHPLSLSPPKRSASDANGSGKKSTPVAKSNAKVAAEKSSRRILVTAGEGQTGCLIIDLLATDDDFTSKYDELTALVFSDEAMSILEEYESLKVILYDPKELVDTCLLILPARKVRVVYC